MTILSFKPQKEAFISTFRRGDRRVMAKLDTGAAISSMPIQALHYLVGGDIKDLCDMILNSYTPRIQAVGFNNVTSQLYFCMIHNIYLGDTHFPKFYFFVDLGNYTLQSSQNAITANAAHSKILLGADFISCCDLFKGRDGTIYTLIVDWDMQKKTAMEACRKYTNKSIQDSDVYPVDAVVPAT